jgi:predicted nucleic acid-binding Zn ribbon protein
MTTQEWNASNHKEYWATKSINIFMQPPTNKCIKCGENEPLMQRNYCERCFTLNKNKLCWVCKTTPYVDQSKACSKECSDVRDYPSIYLNSLR